MDHLTRTWNDLARDLDRFVGSDPLPALRLLATIERDIAERQRTAVRAAATTHSWTDIGAALGVSRQAAHQRYAKEWRDAIKADLKTEHRRMKTAQKQGEAAEAESARVRRDAVIDEVERMARANRRRGR